MRVLNLSYWVLQCKVCDNYHKGKLVNDNPRIIEGPLCGEYECSRLPGKMGFSSSVDWMQMTASEVEQLGL